MFKCRQCGEEVEEPKIYYESYEMWGYPIKRSIAAALTAAVR